jgi:excisionase family DNA binding protein
MDNHDERLLLRIPEAAARLGVGRSTLYDLIADHAIPVVRIGRAVRIPASRLAAWVERQSEDAEALQAR